jgi:hypothetical protein
VRERRGPLGALAGLAEDVLAGARRRQREREPRVIVYDSAGHPRIVPEGEQRDRLLELADELVSLAGPEGE